MPRKQTGILQQKERILILYDFGFNNQESAHRLDERCWQFTMNFPHFV